MAPTPVLTLADLENFDPQAPQKTGERRFLCPLCGEGKPKNAVHRSMCLNNLNGLYHCKRCNSKGRLREHWPEKTARNGRQIVAQQLKRAFEIPVCAAPESDESGATTDWRAIWDASQSFDNTGGQNYLASRGIEAWVAQRAGVRFHRAWHGRAALVFPLQNQNDEVVAVAGRCLRDGGMDKPGAGPKKQGAFFAPAGDFSVFDPRLPAVLLCEAPFDALSLAMAGFPALAFCGTAPPQWLPRALAFRRVMLAFDSDIAGEACAGRVGALLSGFGSRCERLRPEGAKDWNQRLQSVGEVKLGDWLAERVLVS